MVRRRKFMKVLDLLERGGTIELLGLKYRMVDGIINLVSGCGTVTFDTDLNGFILLCESVPEDYIANAIKEFCSK